MRPNLIALILLFAPLAKGAVTHSEPSIWKFTAGVASTTTSSGTLLITGGIGVSGQVTAGGAFKTTDSTASTSSTTGNVLTAGGFASSNTTDASSSTNGGSFTSAGGGAFAKKLYVGGTLTPASGSVSSTAWDYGSSTFGGSGIASFTGTTASTSNTTGTVKTAGGFASSNTTDASSSTNGGSFTSAGGGAFAKKIWAGSDIVTETAILAKSTGSYLVGTQTTPILIKGASGDANGIRISANTGTSAARIVNGYNATLALGVNDTDFLTFAATSGAATFSGQLIGKGTSTNDSAAAGYIGEVLTISNTTNNSLSNGTVFSLGSVSLTAGDWDVWGIASFSGTGATSTFTIAGIGTSNTSLGTNGDGTRAQINQNLASQDSNFAVGPFPLKLSGSTTYYFNIRADFSAGTVTGKGTMYARRAR